MIVFIVIAILALVGLDQITKVWAVTNLYTPNVEIQLWPKVFHLHFTRNEGAAWGILSGKQTFLIILTSLIIVGMIIYIRQFPKTKWGNWGRVAFILIISGAIGNLIDRICLGYVRDFFYFVLINFPIFNVADILVVVGVGLLMLVLLFGDLDGRNMSNKKEEAND